MVAGGVPRGGSDTQARAWDVRGRKNNTRLGYEFRGEGRLERDSRNTAAHSPQASYAKFRSLSISMSQRSATNPCAHGTWGELTMNQNAVSSPYDRGSAAR